MSRISLYEFWEYYNKATKGLLPLLSNKDLLFKPFPEMRSLGEELRHLLDSRDLYIRALTTSVGPSWKEKRMDPEAAVSTEALSQYFLELESRFLEFFNGEIDWKKTIPWEGMGDPDIEACLNWYIHFECTRQGVISTYLAGLNIHYDITG